MKIFPLFSSNINAKNAFSPKLPKWNINAKSSKFLSFSKFSKMPSKSTEDQLAISRHCCNSNQTDHEAGARGFGSWLVRVFTFPSISYQTAIVSSRKHCNCNFFQENIQFSTYSSSTESEHHIEQCKQRNNPNFSFATILPPGAKHKRAIESVAKSVISRSILVALYWD